MGAMAQILERRKFRASRVERLNKWDQNQGTNERQATFSLTLNLWEKQRYGQLTGAETSVVFVEATDEVHLILAIEQGLGWVGGDNEQLSPFTCNQILSGTGTMIYRSPSSPETKELYHHRIWFRGQKKNANSNFCSKKVNKILNLILKITGCYFLKKGEDKNKLLAKEKKSQKTLIRMSRKLHWGNFPGHRVKGDQRK